MQEATENNLTKRYPSIFSLNNELDGLICEITLIGLVSDKFFFLNNLPISLIDSSETKGQITKGKLNNDSPNLFLLEKIEIFMMRIH